MGEKLRDKIAMQALASLLSDFYATSSALDDPMDWKKAIAKQAYEIADAMLEARGEVKSCGEWIKWNGGLCPVDPDLKLQVTLRNGFTYLFGNSRAKDFKWSHTGDTNDIIAYRVVKS